MALVKKEVKYLNKDFGQFRERLVNFAKVYFPDTYTDFNESSPGMMFIEMAAYVGDVLSLYIDNQLRESMLLHAQEEENIYDIAQALGYVPQPSAAATTTLDVFQLVPAVGSGVNIAPDFRYALEVQEGMTIESSENSDVEFRTLENVNFNYSSSSNPTKVSIYKVDDTTGVPQFYLLQKSTKAISGKLEAETFIFDEPKKFDRIRLGPTNVIDVADCKDTDGNKWYEVDYLAQDTVYTEVKQAEAADPLLSTYETEVPYILSLRRVPRRFIKRITSNNQIELHFGAGVSANSDEIILPNPTNIGMQLPYGNTSGLDNAYDPTNVLFTRGYGQAPSDTTLIVRYYTGGGIEANVGAKTLTKVTGVEFVGSFDGLNVGTVDFAKKSVAASNPNPATGGRGQETPEEIRQNALASYATQNRAVTKEDYIARVYSLPGKFGSIAKAYVTRDDGMSSVDPNANPSAYEDQFNPLAINLYCLSYNSSKQLTQPNIATKSNLKTYLKKFRMLTDGINIRNAFIINIGIKFDILARPDSITKEVLLKTVAEAKRYFEIDKWQINEPISLSDLAATLDQVDGVQSILNLNVFNKFDTASGYSGNYFDIGEATKSNIVYPSLDPSIFEVKFPDQDIEARIVGAA
jgi:archaellum component FlaF (FlaF/FlaG flagellin family)